MRRLGRLAAALVVLLVLALPSHADEVDDYLTAQMKERGIPGLALGVWQRGVVVKARGYGVASLEHRTPVTTSTVFDLGGLTKQFTAAAVVALAAEGSIDLGDPIAKYLPDAPAAWARITLRHLLAHTAGFPGRGQGFKALQAAGLQPRYTTAALADAAAKDVLSFPPGDRGQYSDVGYFLLGRVIEKASGRSYRTVLAERFFTPIRMTATAFSKAETIPAHRAEAYVLRDGQLGALALDVQLELPSFYGIFSTVDDLLRWESALARGALLPRRRVDEMWTPVTLADGMTGPYGLGVRVMARAGRRVLAQAGFTGTEWVRVPDDELTVVVLTNLGMVPGGLAAEVATSYVPGLRPSSSRRDP